MQYDNEKIDQTIKEFEYAMISTAKDLADHHEQIIDLLYLGDCYDDPDSVMHSIDIISSVHGFYGMLYYYAVESLTIKQTKYKVWRSEKYCEIQKEIFDNNVELGMTSNNAKPTNKDIESYFDTHIFKTKENKKRQRIINRAEKRVEQLKIMKGTVDTRRDVIGKLSSLLSKCIDSGIVTPGMRKSKRKKVSRAITDRDTI